MKRLRWEKFGSVSICEVADGKFSMVKVSDGQPFYYKEVESQGVAKMVEISRDQFEKVANSEGFIPPE